MKTFYIDKLRIKINNFDSLNKIIKKSFLNYFNNGSYSDAFQFTHYLEFISSESEYRMYRDQKKTYFEIKIHARINSVKALVSSEFNGKRKIIVLIKPNKYYDSIVNKIIKGNSSIDWKFVHFVQMFYIGLIQYDLLKFKSFLMHGMVFSINNKTVIIFSSSQSGKSTFISNYNKFQSIGTDDMFIINSNFEVFCLKKISKKNNVNKFSINKALVSFKDQYAGFSQVEYLLEPDLYYLSRTINDASITDNIKSDLYNEYRNLTAFSYWMQSCTEFSTISDYVSYIVDNFNFINTNIKIYKIFLPYYVNEVEFVENLSRLLLLNAGEML